MSIETATFSFGGKRMTPDYYQAVNRIIRTLRPVASLRTLADHLNQAGYQTPTGLSWDRDRLSNYLRTTAI